MPLAPIGQTPDGLAIVPCAVCDGTDTRRRYRKYGLTLSECLTCGLVFASPRLPVERVMQRYSATYFWNEYLPAVGAPEGRVDLDLVDRRYAPFLAVFGPAPDAGRRMLEIGTGAGLFLKAAERAGWLVQGVEVNPDAAAFARDHLDLDVRTGTAVDVDAPDVSFDAVVMLDVIEHLFDPRDTVETAFRLLRPGGTLLIQTPNFDALSRWALGREWAVLSPMEHLYYFNESTLTRLLTRVGFSSVAFDWAFPAFGSPETMNARYTNRAGSWRSLAYASAVRAGGSRLLEWVQEGRLNDQLLSVARRPEAVTSEAGSPESPASD